MYYRTQRHFIYKFSLARIQDLLYRPLKMASIYDVADGDLFSPQQRDYSRAAQQAGKQRVLDPRSKRMVAVTRAKDRKFDQPRATGVRKKTSLPMTPAEIASVTYFAGQGMTPVEIAVKFGRKVETIKRHLAEAEVEAKKVGINWKEIMRDKAIPAVNDALDCKDDIYKRGVLGKDVLKGLGHFEQDGNLTVNAVIDSIPPAMRARYMELGDDPNVIETTVKEIPDAVPTEKR